MTSYHLRPAVADDLDAIVEVMRSMSVIEAGKADVEAEDLLHSWRAEDFDLAKHTFVAVTPDGGIIGYEQIDPPGASLVHMDGYVHPKYHNQGIGTKLVRAAEERLRSMLAGAEKEVQAMVGGNDANAHAMFEAEGYQLIRKFYRMDISLAEPTAAPVWPEGMLVRAFVLGQDEQGVYETHQEGFSDHWGFEPTPFEKWKEVRMGGESFDPNLWFVAVHDGQIVGIALGRKRNEIGWINSLAVRRAWRKRGVGKALLLHAFAQMRERGLPTVGLGVDAESLTGATRLYLGAGMHVVENFNTFSKRLNA